MPGAAVDRIANAAGPIGAALVLLLLAGCEDQQRAVPDPVADAAPPPGLCAFLTCDDGDPCTADACDPDVGCVHTPAPTVGCGPACVPVARPQGVVSPPGRSIGWRVLTPPGLVLRQTSRRIEIYEARAGAPIAPLGVLWPGTEVRDADWVDGRLHLAAGAAGLLIYDLTDPRAPRLIGRQPTADSALGVRVHDGLAYIADRDGGLRIYDVAEPAAIRAVGELDTDRQEIRIALDPARGRVALGAGSRVLLVDVTDPAAPIAGVDLIATLSDGPTGFVQPEGWLHIHSIGSSRLVDLDAPGGPAYGPRQRAGLLAPRRPEGIYSFDETTRLSLLDVSAVDRAAVVREWPYDDYAIGFAILDDPARAALTGVGHFTVFDLARDALAEPRVAFTHDGNVVDLARVGDRIYVADAAGGLRVVDVADPAAPTEMPAPHVAEFSVGRVAADDGHLVLHELNADLIVFDITDPDAVAEIDRIDFEDYISRPALGVADGHLWVAHARAIHRFALTAEGARPDAQIPWDRPVGDLVPLADPDWAALTTRDALVIVQRTADGLATVAELAWRADSADIARVGDRLYVAGGSGGLLAVDASDPAAPAVVDHWRGAAPRALVAHRERVVLIADDGLWVIGVGPAGFGAAHRLSTLGDPAALALGQDGSTVYLGGRDALVETARLGCE